jgi:hypothetical protein
MGHLWRVMDGIPATELLGGLSISAPMRPIGEPINATKLSLGWEGTAEGQPVLVIGACGFMVDEINGAGFPCFDCLV